MWKSYRSHCSISLRHMEKFRCDIPIDVSRKNHESPRGADPKLLCFCAVRYTVDSSGVEGSARNVPSDLSMSESPYHSHDRYDGTLNRVDVEKERHRAGTIGCSGRNRAL